MAVKRDGCHYFDHLVSSQEAAIRIAREQARDGRMRFVFTDETGSWYVSRVEPSWQSAKRVEAFVPEGFYYRNPFYFDS